MYFFLIVAYFVYVLIYSYRVGYASELSLDAIMGPQARAIAGSRSGKCSSRIPMFHLSGASFYVIHEEYA